MKKIEIYNYDTNETFAVIDTNKRKNFQQEVINYMKNRNFNLIIQGKVIPNIEADIYLLAYNKDNGEKMKLWYREADKKKKLTNIEKDIVDDMF